MYGITIWGGGKGIGQIIKYQKWALRTALNLKFNAHTTYYFKKYDLLQLEDIRNLFIMTKLHLVANQEGHNSYNKYLTFHKLKNRVTNVFEIPFPDSQITKLPQYILPKTWNDYKVTNEELNLSPPAFKKYIKTCMIERYNPTCNTKNCYICNRNN